VSGVLVQRTGFTLVGALFFLWLSMRLVSTLRVALRRVFGLGRERGLIHGKLFDLWVVALGLLLLTVNLSISIALEATFALGDRSFGPRGVALGLAERTFAQGVALASIWVLFVLMYRYLPAQRTPLKMAVVGASFSAVLHEALKNGFSWYVIEIADYSSVFGNLATVIVLFFWIYYESLVFVVGGEVAQVYATMTAGPPVRVPGQVEDEA
jgi:membrane protein